MTRASPAARKPAAPGRPALAPGAWLRRSKRDRPRQVYKLWEEGRAPSLIIEITSPSTKKEDLEYKRDLCQELGVEEYYLFDPERGE